MKKYRITRYNPKYRDINDIFLLDTWTSWSDIGKIYEEYGNSPLTLKEYLLTETQYVKVILAILKSKNIKKLTIQELEKYKTVFESEKLLKSKNIFLNQNEKYIFSSISNNKEYDLKNIETVITLILRDCFWCTLKALNSNLYVRFGYDLYVYIECDYIEKSLVESFDKIYIEKINY